MAVDAKLLGEDLARGTALGLEFLAQQGALNKANAVASAAGAAALSALQKGEAAAEKTYSDIESKAKAVYVAAETKAAAARDDALTAIRQNYETVVAEQAVTVQAETAALDALRLRLEEAQAAIRDVHSVDVNLFPTTTPVNNSLRV